MSVHHILQGCVQIHLLLSSTPIAALRSDRDSIIGARSAIRCSTRLYALYYFALDL